MKYIRGWVFFDHLSIEEKKCVRFQECSVSFVMVVSSLRKQLNVWNGAILVAKEFHLTSTVIRFFWQKNIFSCTLRKNKGTKKSRNAMLCYAIWNKINASITITTMHPVVPSEL